LRQGLGLLILVLVTLACGDGDTSSARRSYEDEVLVLDGALFSDIMDLGAGRGPPSGEQEVLQRQLEDAQSAAEICAEATEHLRNLNPPQGYELGHALLIRFYVQSQRFFLLEG
jgi:hypothetical protein